MSYLVDLTRRDCAKTKCMSYLVKLASHLYTRTLSVL